jgi:hypothetical protein
VVGNLPLQDEKTLAGARQDFRAKKKAKMSIKVRARCGQTASPLSPPLLSTFPSLPRTHTQSSTWPTKSTRVPSASILVRSPAAFSALSVR